MQIVKQRHATICFIFITIFTTGWIIKWFVLKSETSLIWNCLCFVGWWNPYVLLVKSLSRRIAFFLLRAVTQNHLIRIVCPCLGNIFFHPKKLKTWVNVIFKMISMGGKHINYVLQSFYSNDPHFQKCINLEPKGDWIYEFRECHRQTILERNDLWVFISSHSPLPELTLT